MRRWLCQLLLKTTATSNQSTNSLPSSHSDVRRQSRWCHPPLPPPSTLCQSWIFEGATYIHQKENYPSLATQELFFPPVRTGLTMSIHYGDSFPTDG